jgi:ABC-type spermidine/putrescine transport system permease subunit I
MTLLQIAYVLDIMVSVPVAFTTLIGHERAARFLFKESLPASDSFRIILGSLWMAVLLCCIAGIFFPIAMSPILLLQVIYKGLWLMLFAVPRWIGGRGAEVPKRITGICLATIIAFPWVIPWSMLFASKQ